MDAPTVEQCENLMNIVVESRKRFGKMCVDYEQKTSLMENKTLHFQLEKISNYRFKPKVTAADLENDDAASEELENLLQELETRKNRLDSLKDRIKGTQKVVAQIQNDSVGRKIVLPLTAEKMLSIVKAKTAK